MKNGRPIYFYYLRAWVSIWLLVSLPEDISTIFDEIYYHHGSAFADSTIQPLADTAILTAIFLPFEALLGLFFGFFFWLLQRGMLSMLQRLRVTDRFAEKANNVSPSSMIAASLTATLAFIVIGLPWGILIWNMYLHPILPPDGIGPSPSLITMEIRSIGQTVSFPIACLIAAYITRNDPRWYSSIRQASLPKPETLSEYG